MSELRSLYGSKARLAFVVLVVMLMVLLPACSSSALPKVKLRVDKVSLPDGGGTVLLRLEVTEGTVTSVVFRKQDGTESVTVSTPTSPGVFENERTVTTTTTFVAEAIGPSGKTSETLDVEVAPPNPANDPQAPSSTTPLKGFVNYAVTAGTPTGPAVVVTEIPGVTGSIVGEVKAETKATEKSGTVTIQAGTNTLVFTYTPKAGVTSDSFEYVVAKAGREAKGKISLSLSNVPSNYVFADDISDINNASASKTIILVADISCRTNECIRLETGQTLTGSTMIDGLAFTNPNAKIVADILGTRKPGGPPGLGEHKVVILADDTTVENLEITGKGERYFSAIYGNADNGYNIGGDFLEGEITIRNVVIDQATGKAIYLKYYLPTLVKDPGFEYGNYNLYIEKLNLRNAKDTLVIGHPTTILVKDTKIHSTGANDVNGQPAPFGDTEGIELFTDIETAATFDNVDVTSDITDTSFYPFVFIGNDTHTDMRLTMKFCDVFLTDVSAGTAKSFLFTARGGATIAIATNSSTENSTQATSSSTLFYNNNGGAGSISGYIKGKLGNGANFPER